MVVRSHDNQQQTILATAELTEGPLRYGGPFGRIPFFVSSQYVTTFGQAHDYAWAQLAKVSTVPAVKYTVQCLPDPRREVGDVVSFVHEGKNWVGRIQQMTLANAGLMTLNVLVRPGNPFHVPRNIWPGLGEGPAGEGELGD